MKKPIWYLEESIRRTKTESQRFDEIEQANPELVQKARNLSQLSNEELDKRLKELLGE